MIKNHPLGKSLLLDVVQRVIKTHSLNDMALCGREKQREREVFQAFSPDQKGQIENLIFVNPFDSTGFTGKKKADHMVGVIFLVGDTKIKRTKSLFSK